LQNFMYVFAQEVLSLQIDGMRELFSKIAPLNGAADVQNNAFLSALPALTRQKQPDRDSVVLSDIGKKLHLNEKESSSLIEKQKIELPDLLPPWAQRIDRALSQTMDILERMRKLAVAAQDEELSDIDRVDMQIQIEDLRANLMAMPRNLRGGEPLARLPNQTIAQGSSPGDYERGDYSSVLGRMQERILNGEEWNVREAWCPEDFSRVTYDENGEEVWEVFEANAWYVVDDSNVLTYRKGKLVDSGRKVSTVREKLEWANPVVVMDAESAAEEAAYLEKKIASIQRWRKQLPENLENLSTEDAASFLDTIAFPGGDINDPLTNPTCAGNFLFDDGISDYRYVNYYFTEKILGLESDGSDIAPADEEILKNERIVAGWVNENGDVRVVYRYSTPALRTEEVAAAPLNERKIIYAKGIRVLDDGGRFKNPLTYGGIAPTRNRGAALSDPVIASFQKKPGGNAPRFLFGSKIEGLSKINGFRKPRRRES
jgi:hypothetical protein